MGFACFGGFLAARKKQGRGDVFSLEMHVAVFFDEGTWRGPKTRMCAHTIYRGKRHIHEVSGAGQERKKTAMSIR